jgi:uncharacterized repeat protein (TIGR04076 family)
MTEKEFDWSKFQRRMHYTDEDLARFKADTRKERAAKKIFSREIAKKYLVIEVVSSHGCSAGMKPGDRLFFKALGVLDTEKSSPWCAAALGEIAGFANMAQDRFVAGLDPNDMVFNHFACMDAGARFGWGQVVMKAYVVDADDVENLSNKKSTSHGS